jgi:hypothetical protein
MAKTMIGTNVPQKLFGDIPASASQVPGITTPNITAAMPNYVDLEGILDAQNKQKEISANAWARAAAANQARQQQQQQGDEQAKVRAAFDEWWRPQIRNQSHDVAFALDNARGAQLRKQYANLPGGYFASGRSYNEGKVPYQGANEQQLQQQLDNMWRMQTDPYMKAAMGGASASTLFNLGTPGKGGNMPGRRSSGGGGGSSGGGYYTGGGAGGGAAGTYNPQEYDPRNVGPQFRYDPFSGR